MKDHLRRKCQKSLLGVVLLASSFNAAAGMILPEEGGMIGPPLPALAQTDPRIEKIKEMVRETKPGEDLLAFLERHDSTIALKNSMEIIPDSMKHLEGIKLSGFTFGKDISLNSDSKDTELAETLAHEGRHVRQAALISLLGGNRSIREEWILLRFREADAHVFPLYLAHLSDKRNNIPFTESIEKVCGNENEICIRAHFEKDMKDGKPLSAAYRAAIERGLSLVEEKGYKGPIHAGLKALWQRGLDDPNFGTALARGMCIETSFSSLPEMIKLFTSIKDENGNDIFPLAGWTDERIMNEKETGGALPEEQVGEIEALKERALAPHPKCSAPVPQT